MDAPTTGSSRRARAEFPAFPTNLRRARLGRRLSLRALAARVGVSAQTIVYYETGRSYPSSSVLVRLSRAVGVDIERLMSGEVCVPKPRPKPPKTRLERAQRWAAAWRFSARRWRAWAQSRAAREREALEALRALVEAVDDAMTTNAEAVDAAMRRAWGLLEEEGL